MRWGPGSGAVHGEIVDGVLLVKAPWGEMCRPEDIDPAAWFAWPHYQAGHRYRVFGSAMTATAIECDCGERWDRGEPE